MVVGHNGNDGNDGGSFIMINIAIIIITIIHFYLSTADDISYPGRVAQHIGVNLVQSIQTEIFLEFRGIFFRKKNLFGLKLFWQFCLKLFFCIPLEEDYFRLLPNKLSKT